MTLTMITDSVSVLNNNVEYDINVWTEESDQYVNLVFYPLVYPGDANYPDSDLLHGLPVADYTTYYALRIPKWARGPRFREALDYLRGVVNDGSFSDEWALDGMDWTSCEPALVDPPALIAEFVAKLPRRNR